MKTKHQRLYITVYSSAGDDSLAIISLHGGVSGTHYQNICNTRSIYSRQQDATRNCSTFSAFLGRCLVFFLHNLIIRYDWLRNCTTPFYNMNHVSLSLWKRNKVINIRSFSVTLYLFISFFKFDTLAMLFADFKIDLFITLPLLKIKNTSNIRVGQSSRLI